MGKKKSDMMFTDDKEADIMPVIELVECERASYIKELEEYLCNLKNMPDSEAIKKCRSNLINSKIIQENGEFTERYKYSRRHTDLLRKRHFKPLIPDSKWSLV